MNFAHPEILYGLLAVLIPLIVHLFNFRRYKKFYFSNVALLKDISFETKKQSRLKHLIVMILRMLAIVALVIAFARPSFNEETTALKSEKNITGIYIDNSFSMEAGGRNGRLFDHAVAGAREIIKRSSRDSKFIVLSNSGNLLLNLLNKDEALSKVDNLRISAYHKSFATILNNFQRLKSKNKNYALNVYAFSDYQSSAFNISDFPADSLVKWNFVMIPHQDTRNILIDSCWIEDPIVLPEKITTLYVKLKNISTQDYEKAGLKLFINGKNKSIATTDLQSDSEKIIKMQFNTGKEGWKSAYLEIEDYPITFDDILYFSFFVDKKINVLAINSSGEDKYLKAFYSSDSVFNLKQQDYKLIDYQIFSNNQLIILNSISEISSGLISQLKSYVDKGGNLMILPPEDGDLKSLNTLLKQFDAGSINGPSDIETRVKGIKLNNSIFSNAIENIPENADLPVIFKKYNLNNNYTNQLETIISILNGESFLVKKEFGNGIVNIITVPISPDFSNLASHPLFIPLMYGIAIDGKGFQTLFYTIGDDKEIIVNFPNGNSDNQDLVFDFKKANEGQSYIPIQQFRGNDLIITLPENMEEAGIYQLSKLGSLETNIALNYNRQESIMEFYSDRSLEEELEQSNLKNYQIIKLQSGSQQEIINSMQNESRLWLVFIIFALSFLLTEIIVLRFWP